MIKKYSLFFLLILIIIIYMSLENWGGMSKAQDNAQTIDEAISAAILAHEEDPESHMGVGESIENHRVNDVIDHPAQSIVPDKFDSNQPSMQNFFVNPSSYYEEGNVNQNGDGQIYVYVSNSSPAYSLVGIPLTFLDSQAFPDNDILLDFVLRLVSGGSTYACDVYIGEDENGFGIKFNHSGLKLFKYVNSDYTETANVTFSWGQAKSFRLFLDSTSQALLLFINGVQVASLPMTETGYQIYDAALYVKTTSGNPASSNAYISMLRAYYKI